MTKNFNNLECSPSSQQDDTFDSFYEVSNFKVVSILQNNMFKIENLNDRNDIRTVFKGRLKKINSF